MVVKGFGEQFEGTFQLTAIAWRDKLDHMNDIQDRLETLEAKRWTLRAIADEIGSHWTTVARWKAGGQYPGNPKPFLIALDLLAKRKKIPKQRRYAKGSRGQAGLDT